MRERHRFRPGGWDCLESRLALTHGGPISPGLIGTLSPNPRASGAAGRAVAQVNAAFNQFTVNYLQAQGAYLSSGTSNDSKAFQAYTTQAIAVLAQELTRTLARLPGSLVYIKNKTQRDRTGSSVVLQAILHSQITGADDPTLTPDALQKTLNTSVPMTPPTGASATLYTLTATNAIQAAQIGIINSIRYLVNHTFNNGHN
jgi:hypothetical protein